MAELRVGVAGATGALGGEVLKVLDAAPWRPDEVVPLASPATQVPFVDYGDRQVAVDDLGDQALADLDALIVAVPREVAGPVARRAMDDDIVVVDLSGALSAEVPMVVPWINPEAIEDAIERRAAVLPSAPALLIGTAIAALRAAGIDGPIEATVLVPASVRGRGGIEELSRQVIALFNSGTPPRKIFPHGLAFDLLPQMAPLDDEGWTTEERRVVADLARLVGPVDAHVTLVGVPVFSGLSATVVVRPSRVAPVGLIEQILSDGGLALPKDAGARHLPRPRRVEGEAVVQAGRVRVDPAGETVHFWLAMDNLRVMASAAVGLCGALLRPPEGD